MQSSISLQDCLNKGDSLELIISKERAYEAHRAHIR